MGQREKVNCHRCSVSLHQPLELQQPLGIASSWAEETSPTIVPLQWSVTGCGLFREGGCDIEQEGSLKRRLALRSLKATGHLLKTFPGGRTTRLPLKGDGMSACLRSPRVQGLVLIGADHLTCLPVPSLFFLLLPFPLPPLLLGLFVPLYRIEPL